MAALRAAADADGGASLDDLPAVLEAIAATSLSPQAQAVLAATVATLEALQTSAFRLAEVMELEP